MPFALNNLSLATRVCKLQFTAWRLLKGRKRGISDPGLDGTDCRSAARGSHRADIPLISSEARLVYKRFIKEWIHYQISTRLNNRQRAVGYLPGPIHYLENIRPTTISLICWVIQLLASRLSRQWLKSFSRAMLRMRPIASLEGLIIPAYFVSNGGCWVNP